MFNDWELYQFSLTLGLIMLAFSIFDGAFILVSFAIGIFSVTALHLYFQEFDFARDLTVLSIVSFFAFFVLRFIFAKKGDVEKSVEDVNKY